MCCVLTAGRVRASICEGCDGNDPQTAHQLSRGARSGLGVSRSFDKCRCQYIPGQYIPGLVKIRKVPSCRGFPQSPSRGAAVPPSAQAPVAWFPSLHTALELCRGGAPAACLLSCVRFGTSRRRVCVVLGLLVAGGPPCAQCPQVFSRRGHSAGFQFAAVRTKAAVCVYAAS